MTETETATSNSNAHRAVVHADGTVTYVDVNAIGGEMDDMPKGYFKSVPFIGTVVVRIPVPPTLMLD
jgi:hypothetical protein